MIVSDLITVTQFAIENKHSGIGLIKKSNQPECPVKNISACVNRFSHFFHLRMRFASRSTMVWVSNNKFKLKVLSNCFIKLYNPLCINATEIVVSYSFRDMLLRFPSYCKFPSMENSFDLLL